MRTPPDDLTDDDLRRVLADHWELTDVTLTYAPVGFGSHHWVATVAGEPAWFVTVDRNRPSLWTAFETAASLRDDARLPFVIAPEWGDRGEVLARCGAGHLVSLTSFLPQVRDWPDDAAATPTHQLALVELVVALHGATDEIADEPWPDDFGIESRLELEDALARVDRPWTGGLHAEGVRGRLRAAAEKVRADLAQYDTLVRRVQARGADADPGLLDRYTTWTGHTVDLDALALYRMRWGLTDIALYVDDLCGAPARTADTDVRWRTLRRRLASPGTMSATTTSPTGGTP